MEDPDMDELVRHASIRLMNSIASKVDKYRKSYSGLEHVKGKPFVLCIGAFEQPYFWRQRDRALVRVLYAYNEPLLVETSNARYLVGHDQQSSEQKDGGAPLDFGIFTRPGMDEISAILFSSLATFGKVQALAGNSEVTVIFEALRYDAKSTTPKHIVGKRPDYEETLLDGLHLCVNPFARESLNREAFEDCGVVIHSYDSTTNEYLVNPPDGHLYLRECCVIKVVDDEPRTVPARPATTYRSPKAPEWPEGELRRADGATFLFKDDHLAHYRGWTIHTAYDGEDWMGHALRVKVRNLADFIRENKKEQVPYCVPSQLYADKEEARDAMIKAIDRFESGESPEKGQPVFDPSKVRP